MGKLSHLKVFLSQSVSEYLSNIEYCIAEIAVRLGTRIELSQDRAKGPFHFSYGEPLPDAKTVHIPFDPRCFHPSSVFKGLGNPVLWTHQDVQDETEIDLIGGAFRLLAFLDESQVAEDERDRLGVFHTDALPESRRVLRAEPIMENHVRKLSAILDAPEMHDNIMAKWPNGKKWALLVTHDTDAVHLGAGAEIAFNLAKAIIRRQSLRFKMIKDGFRAMRNPIAENPLYGFTRWQEIERAKSIRSAFYLFLRQHVSFDLNDCRSSVGDRRFKWKELRTMANDGWEFGLHPPILAKGNLDEFLSGKRYIEENIECPIFGLRHHYWALDWRKPHLTYRKHVNAGFRYDLSIAWQDAPGFRAGTCFPFRPWDPSRSRGLDIYAIPTSILDGHVIPSQDGSEFDLEQSSIAAKEILDKVRKHEGVANLDWHTEAACNHYLYKGHVAVLDEINLTLDLSFTAHSLDKAWV